MGIYVCKARTLQHLLNERFADKHDFGSDIIPGAKDEGYTVQVSSRGVVAAKACSNISTEMSCPHLHARASTL